MTRHFAISAILLAASSTAWPQQPKAYNLPRVDLKQRFIWNSQCEGANGFLLGFGGQDQESDELPLTRVKEGKAWRSISEELRKRSEIEAVAEMPLARPIARAMREFLASHRSVYLQGGSNEKAVDLVRGQLNDQRKYAHIFQDYLIEHRQQIAKHSYANLQATWANQKIAEVRARSLARIDDGDMLELIRRLTFDQIAFEQAVEAMSPEPPARALSPLVYDKKTDLFVLFGGDRGDYLTNDLWVFNKATMSWQQRHPTFSPPPRANHQWKANGDGTVTMTGGYTYTSNTSYCGPQYRDIADGDWTFDLEANEWKGARKSVPSDQRVYRTGPFHPDYFLQGDPPNPAAVKATLTNLPANRWVEMKAPRKPELCRTWGHAIMHGDRIFVFSGGHSAHGGSDVLHYHLGTNRWELPFPVEFPLGQLYSNTEYPRGFNLNRRPWVTGHTYQSYHVHPETGLIYFVGQAGYCYAYHPDKAEWVGRRPTPDAMTYGDAFYTLELARTSDDLVCWTARGSAFSLNGKRKDDLQLTKSGAFQGSSVFERIPHTGDKLPSSVVDASTFVHDAKRDRLLFFRTNYGKVYEGETHSMDVKTGAVKRLSPKGSKTLASLGFRECDRGVYDPESDLVLFGALLPSEAGADRRSLAYDCAGDRWVTLVIGYESAKGKRPAAPYGSGHSCGLMFDANRKLIWGVDTHELRVYALRFDPKTADLRALAEE